MKVGTGMRDYSSPSLPPCTHKYSCVDRFYENLCVYKEFRKQLSNGVLWFIHIALMYYTWDGKYCEMPCKVNKSCVQLVQKPWTMLLGHAAAAGGLCKDEHFWCVELKPESDVHEICDFCSQCMVAGFAGIILVNFKDDVSLSEAFWKIVVDHQVTVVVVPKRHGDTFLEMMGGDMMIMVSKRGLNTSQAH